LTAFELRCSGKDCALKAPLAALIGIILVSLMPLFTAVPAAHSRIELLPKLVAGQIITYRLSYRTEKKAKTQSAFITAEPAVNPNVDLRALLRLEVLGVEAQGARSVLHFRAVYQTIDPSAESSSPRGKSPAPESPRGVSAVPIEFTILADGRLSNVKNLDALLPEQQEAWKEWAARFAAPVAFPEKGIALGQKWKSEEPERTAAPIAGLSWLRESFYLRNEPCRSVTLTPQGDLSSSGGAAEMCAVIFTSATLKQKSDREDATPEDFKLHDLHTSGAATGNNKTTLYISLPTGLLVRSSDDADQSMDVTIGKPDETNRVHYAIHAQSHAEILRVTNVPPVT
jgi:hypothetical protein